MQPIMEFQYCTLTICLAPQLFLTLVLSYGRYLDWTFLGTQSYLRSALGGFACSEHRRKQKDTMLRHITVINSQRVSSILVPCVRRLHDASNPVEAKDAEEIRIPVPWGHIAGKWWGDSDKNPMVGLHGWEDNAGTFDNLAPLLKNSSLLAIDLPGHGLSSFHPPGRPYYLLDSVMVLRRLMKYFNWNTISLIGHSYGSCTSFIFSSVYPQLVDNFISVDCARTLMAPDTLTELGQMRNIADNLIPLENKIASKRPPSYTYEKIVELLRSGSLESPTKESCEILLKRGMLPSEDSGNVYFARDPRLRFHALGRLPYDFILTMAKKINCNCLSIRGKQGLIEGEKEEIYRQSLDLMKKPMKKFEHYDVEGTHHLHLNNPERIAPLINKFLS